MLAVLAQQLRECRTKDQFPTQANDATTPEERMKLEQSFGAVCAVSWLQWTVDNGHNIVLSV